MDFADAGTLRRGPRRRPPHHRSRSHQRRLRLHHRHGHRRKSSSRSRSRRQRNSLEQRSVPNHRRRQKRRLVARHFARQLDHSSAHHLSQGLRLAERFAAHHGARRLRIANPGKRRRSAPDHARPPSSFLRRERRFRRRNQRLISFSVERYQLRVFRRHGRDRLHLARRRRHRHHEHHARQRHRTYPRNRRPQSARRAPQ